MPYKRLQKTLDGKDHTQSVEEYPQKSVVFVKLKETIFLIIAE